MIHKKVSQYFRINNDLLLWEPTAPSPVETVESMPYGVGLSVASQLINTYSKDSFSQFRSTGPEGKTIKNTYYEFTSCHTFLSEMSRARSALNFIDMHCVVLSDETSGSEEETMHYYSPASDLGLRSRKKKKPKAQSKTSQSLFSVVLSVNHGLASLQTNVKVKSRPF